MVFPPLKYLFLEVYLKKLNLAITCTPEKHRISLT